MTMITGILSAILVVVVGVMSWFIFSFNNRLEKIENVDLVEFWNLDGLKDSDPVQEIMDREEERLEERINEAYMNASGLRGISDPDNSYRDNVSEHIQSLINGLIKMTNAGKLTWESEWVHGISKTAEITELGDLEVGSFDEGLLILSKQKPKPRHWRIIRSEKYDIEGCDELNKYASMASSSGVTLDQINKVTHKISSKEGIK